MNFEIEELFINGGMLFINGGKLWYRLSLYFFFLGKSNSWLAYYFLVAAHMRPSHYF